MYILHKVKNEKHQIFIHFSNYCLYNECKFSNMWSPVGTGMNSLVWALTVYDTNLYAGGGFTIAGGNPASFITSWNGTDWSALGTGINNVALAFAVYNAELYVGGQFTTAGGIPANYIARWTIPTGVQESFTNSTISVFPNPTNNNFTISVPPVTKRIQIANSLGQIVQRNIVDGQTNLDFEITQNGIYFIQIITDKETVTKKLIVTN